MQMGDIKTLGLVCSLASAAAYRLLEIPGWLSSLPQLMRLRIMATGCLDN